VIADFMAPTNVEVDGIVYPARDTRMDGRLGAKRVEWSFKDANGIPWAPVPGANDPAMACGVAPGPPALKAYARAGAKVTIEWSGIVRTHYGPTMTYLAPLSSSGTRPQELSFFKIHERGYNPQTKLWANEELIKADRRNTVQIPSDIKPGLYVLRTELLALHYSSKQGPQFYPHCFNIMINGTGTATPPGVKFPGAYPARDPSLVSPLYTKTGAPNGWDKYVIPGPPKYAGKYDAPIGPPRVVSDKDRGIFPPEFQAKYEAFKKKEDAEGLAFNDKLNAAQASLQHNEVKSEANLGPAFMEHAKATQQFQRELASLKAEAIKLGIAE